MVAPSSFPRSYVDEVRESLRSQVAAYDQLVAVVGADGSDPASDVALEAIEPVVFNNLLIALEASFADRARSREGKEGNPLNEVRMLVAALVTNRGVFTQDSSVSYRADQSVLGYKEGDRVALDKEDFVRLAEAFLTSIEEKYP